MSGATTRVPSGIDAAISPMRPETVELTATDEASTLTSRAHVARARSVVSFQSSQFARPPRQSASAACSASQAGRGGRPKLAVFR